jgi:hypothetical protein
MAINKTFSTIYILAGLYNFSILIFCNFFRKNLGEIDDIFNFNGIIAILLWGLAYMSIHNKYEDLILLNIVFFIEKLFYYIHWLVWIIKNFHNIKPLFVYDKMIGLFFSGYGVGDLCFGLFFLYMSFLSFRKQTKVSEKTRTE